uniref:Uncharacterized protein n=1 Tax=Oryza barthii TaxID=65489 RepID=A0A0D3HEP5_9ORYZ
MGGGAATAAAAPGFGAALVSRWIGGVRPGSSVGNELAFTSSSSLMGWQKSKAMVVAVARAWPSSVRRRPCKHGRAQRSVNDNGHMDVAELSTVSATML